MKITKRQLRRLIQEAAPRSKTPSLKSLLFEDEAKKAADDLETAFKRGPEGVRAFMDKQGNKDPKVKDVLIGASGPEDRVSVGSASPVDVKDLGPTQQFIDLMQSVSFPLGSADILDSSVRTKTTGAPGAISISGNAVLDGHHRWSSVYAITPDGSINAKDFEFPGTVKDKLAAAQLAVAAVNKTDKHPSKGGGAATDIIGKGKDDIVKMIDDNKGRQTDSNAPGSLLNDDMIKSIAAGEFPAILSWAGLPESGNKFVPLAESEAEFANDPVRKAIAEKVGENLASLPSPLDGAPESREDMPQLDHESIGGKTGLAAIEQGLPAGEFNAVPPFAEGRNLIEGWAKIAGLLKTDENE